jgi:peptidoglycan/LPS O-acetylase OafA/YrhL
LKTISFQRIYFSNLDGLRFILACVVLFSHSQLGEVLIRVSPFDFTDRILRVFSTGGMAVSFFFVLSGFLITYLLMEEEQTRSEIDIRKFYIRRILRIWPLYYTVLIFSFFIYPWVKSMLGYPNDNPHDFLYQAFFLSNFDSLRVHEQGLVGVSPMMININWSIAIEEQFYLVWPLLFLLSHSRRFILILIIALGTSFFFSWSTSSGYILYYHSLSVLSDFAIGGLAAYLCMFNPAMLRGVQSLNKWIIVAVYSLGFIWLMYGPDLVSDEPPLAIGRWINSIFFAFVIVEQNYATHSFYKTGKWKRISSWGKYTYGLYLLNPIGVQFSIILFRYLDIDRTSGIFPGLVYAGIASAVAFSLAVLSYHYIESYFLSLRSKFY